MQVIKTKDGYAVMVDDQDYALVSQYTWSVTSRNNLQYAYRKVAIKTDDRENWGWTTRIRLMHQDIMPGHPMIDHVDGNGLNNLRNNLRPTTMSNNLANQGKHKMGWRGHECTSRYKGVCWVEKFQKWVATIVKAGHQYWLGKFDDETEAARAYDKKAIELYGEYAKTNSQLELYGKHELLGSGVQHEQQAPAVLCGRPVLFKSLAKWDRHRGA